MAESIVPFVRRVDTLPFFSTFSFLPCALEAWKWHESLKKSSLLTCVKKNIFTGLELWGIIHSKLKKSLLLCESVSVVFLKSLLSRTDFKANFNNNYDIVGYWKRGDQSLGK